MNQLINRAVADVLAERARQDEKWGQQNHDPFLYLAILGEEFGETCQAALHLQFGGKGVARLSTEAYENLRTEAMQTAAVALALVECLDRDLWRWGVYLSSVEQ